ncbi:MAG: aminotransferase class V-fold PLP-dependent enzyme [Pseudomonadota bacterium]
MLWLNHAGFGAPTAQTRAAISAHIAREDEVGFLQAAEDAAPTLEAGLQTLADLIGCSREHVAFTTTTCANWQAALSRTPLAGKKLLLARHEWGDNIVFTEQLAAMTGATVEQLDHLTDPSDFSPWQSAITDDVAVIAVTATTSVSGMVCPIDGVAALSRPDDALILVDAAQAYGRVPMAMFRDADIVVGTGRKWLRGPRGVAILKFSERAERVLGLTAAKFIPGDQPVPQRIGLCAAIAHYAAEGEEVVHRAIAERSDILANTLTAAGLAILGGPTRAPGTVTVMIPDERKPAVDALLAAEGVIAKWPTPDTEEPWFPVSGPGIALRISPHVDTPADDLAKFANHLVEVAA